MNKPTGTWAVVMADTGADRPRYMAWADFYPTRKKAVAAIEEAVADERQMGFPEPRIEENIYGEPYLWDTETEDGRSIVRKVQEVRV